MRIIILITLLTIAMIAHSITIAPRDEFGNNIKYEDIKDITPQVYQIGKTLRLKSGREVFLQMGQEMNLSDGDIKDILAAGYDVQRGY